MQWVVQVTALARAPSKPYKQAEGAGQTRLDNFVMGRKNGGRPGPQRFERLFGGQACGREGVD